jgi:hypothetical protein
LYWNPGRQERKAAGSFDVLSEGQKFANKLMLYVSVSGDLLQRILNQARVVTLLRGGYRDDYPTRRRWRKQIRME